MIILTQLNGSATFAVNPDLIERIEQLGPDTMLLMVDGVKYRVRESTEEVIDLIVEYRARVLSVAYANAPAARSAEVQP